MVLSTNTNIIVLSIVVSLSLILGIIYQPTSYWDKQKIINELQIKNHNIETKRIQLLSLYQKGQLTKEQTLIAMKDLLNKTKDHLKEIEEKVSFLNVSHNFKKANQLIIDIKNDIQYLETLQHIENKRMTF